MEFYERIKDLVKKSNLTLKQFIEDAGVNYETYNSLKRYDNLPRADDCVKLAKHLGVSVEYLVTGKENSLINEDEAEVVEMYRQTPKSLRRMFKSVLKEFTKATDTGDDTMYFSSSELENVTSSKLEEK